MPILSPENDSGPSCEARAGGGLLFNAAVVVPGNHEDTGNGHARDDKGDHSDRSSFWLRPPHRRRYGALAFLTPGSFTGLGKSGLGVLDYASSGTSPAKVIKNSPENID